MQPRVAIALGVAALAGVLAAVLLFPSVDAEVVGPSTSGGAVSAQSSGSRAGPAPTPSLPPTAPASPAVEPVAEVDTSPEAVARWVAEEPVAQHAVRDAHRWAEVAERFRALGNEDLALQAESMAMRLERTKEPRPEEEVRDLLVEEINLFRAFHATEPDADLKALLQDIEMGAHHAIQGAPTPEVTAEQERLLRQEREGK